MSTSKIGLSLAFAMLLTGSAAYAEDQITVQKSVIPKSGGSGECIMKSNIATSPTHHSGLRFQILEGSKGVVGEILKS